jgi:hypothetical protein
VHQVGFHAAMIRQNALWVTGRGEELSVSNVGRLANGTKSVAT